MERASTRKGTSSRKSVIGRRALLQDLLSGAMFGKKKCRDSAFCAIATQPLRIGDNFMKSFSFLKMCMAGFVASLTLSASALAQYKTFPIAFTEWSGPVPASNASNPDFYDAQEAFVAKYGAEGGLVGTAVGTRGELMILTDSVRSTRQLWRKMQGSGDVVSNGAVAYLRYLDPNATTPPVSKFQFVGKINVEEGTRGTFWMTNGTPSIVAYKVAMEEKCGLMKSGVQMADGSSPAIPTRLVRSERIGGFTIAYEHSVNGGAGGLLRLISVDIARRGGPFIVDICPVHLYVQYAE